MGSHCWDPLSSTSVCHLQKMGVQVNTGVLKSPRGLLKICCLCLVIIDLVLARTGFSNGTSPLAIYTDAYWVKVVSVCSYCFILAIMILSYLLGDDVPIRMEMMFQFLGAVLFLTSVSLVVDSYQSLVINKDVWIGSGQHDHHHRYLYAPGLCSFGQDP